MKIALALLVLFSGSAFALQPAPAQQGQQQYKKPVDYVVEVGMLVVSGDAANDLFDSLNAKELLHPMATKYDRLTSKRNAFASCQRSYSRTDNDEGPVWNVDWTVCKLVAPEGTVNKGTEE